MIRTRLQGDAPFFPNMLNNANIEVCLKEDVDEAIAELRDENATLRGANEEKTERIMELQKQVDELDATIEKLVDVKKSADQILQNLLTSKGGRK